MVALSRLGNALHYGLKNYVLHSRLGILRILSFGERGEHKLRGDI